MTTLLVVLILLVVLLVYLVLLSYGFKSYMRGKTNGYRPLEEQGPECFVIKRKEDVTGISGVGIVGEGVVFSDGWGVTHWLDRPPMNEPKTEIWHKPWYRRRGPDPFTKISGHGGKTVLVWVDRP